MTVLTKVTEHVYWLPPAPPDRPSLCAVAGDRRTLMLDAGSSAAHTAEVLDALAAGGVARPSAVVYTHSDWDHVLGGVAVGGLVIAHALTAERLVEMAQRDWSDEGLDRRVALGLSPPRHAEDVKTELPSPRSVAIAPADIVFHDRIDIDIGGATVHVRHVGGDHNPESSVMFVEPDRLLFLGDCLGTSSEGGLTAESAFRVRDAILGFDAEHYVEGHHEAVSSRREMEDLFHKMELAERAVREESVIAAPDEDTAYFLQAFTLGRAPAD
jgi:glyoxylase-like metal-dependent hydrolase (beta-lactamase superfamily II)